MTDLERRVDRLERITGNGTAVFVRKDVYTAEMKAVVQEVHAQTKAIEDLETAHKADAAGRETSKKQLTITLVAASFAIVTQFVFWVIDRLSTTPIPGVNQ